MAAFGLLLALMEPEAKLQDEFDDWYDFEHIPHMSAVDGILSAQRFIVVEGWPRYAAVYDLDAVSVLTSASYRAVTGGGFSPWSRRMLQRVRGWRRLTFEQLQPGRASTLDASGALGIALLADPAASSGLAEWLGDDPGTLQVRAYGPAASGPAAVLWEAGSIGSLARPPEALLRNSTWSARLIRYSRVDPASAFARLEAAGSP